MRSLLVLVVLVSTAAASPSAAQLAADRVVAASKAYAAAVARLDVVPPEDIYRWSMRWLDAQLDDPATGKAVPQAFAAHAKRMEDLETQVKASFQQGLKPAFDLASSSYYRIEAELWVARGKK